MRTIVLSGAIAAFFGWLLWFFTIGDGGFEAMCKIGDLTGKSENLPFCGEHTDEADKVVPVQYRFLAGLIILLVALGIILSLYAKMREGAVLLWRDLNGSKRALDTETEEKETIDMPSLMAQLEPLEKMGDQLSDEQKQRLLVLRGQLVDATLDAVEGDIPQGAFKENDAPSKREAIEEIVSEGDELERSALALIASGELAPGLDVLETEARSATSDAVEHWERIGQMTYQIDTLRSRSAYEKVYLMDPANVGAGVYLARLQLRNGDLTTAMETLEAIGMGLKDGDSRDRMALLNETGNVKVVSGDLASALASYQSAIEIAKRLAESDSRNTNLQRDLFVSHIKIGDILQAQADLDESLASYQSAMKIAKNLAASDYGNTEWQRDLSVSHNRIGDVLHAQGDLDGALSGYQSAMAIVKRLAASDTQNTDWQRDLSVCHDNIGDIQRAQGDLDGAPASYQSDLEIAERLATSDTGNTDWQRDLSVSFGKLGNAQLALGDLVSAAKSLTSALGIAEQLILIDAGNHRGKLDILSFMHNLSQIPGSGVSKDDVKTRAEELGIDLDE